MNDPGEKRPTGLEHVVSWYVKNYGLPISTVQNYRRRGWNLDDPKALLEKIMKAHGKKPPLQALLNLVNGQQGPSTVKRGQSRNAPKPPDDVPPPPPPTEGSGIKQGLRAELDRLEKETAESYEKYRFAPEGTADKLVAQKLYLANVNALRALAKDAPKADKDAKNLVPVAEVDSVWSRSLKEFRSAAEALPRREATKPLYRKLDPVEVELSLRGEVSEMIARLEAGSWLIKAEDPTP